MMFTRRSFLKASAAGFGAAVLSLGITGCTFDNDDGEIIEVSFDHGVASGDPISDSLILWTRVTPLDAATTSIKVQWQAATDPNFSNIVHDGETHVSDATDFTLKVDLQGLDANTTYYYRFISNGKTSPVGSGKTLPTGSIDKVKFAVVLCANYPAGFFHVYGEIATQTDLDAVLQLGDYIYEYGNGGYASQDATLLGRLLRQDNSEEIISLTDYRKRYAHYRTDSNLKAAHSYCCAKNLAVLAGDTHNAWAGQLTTDASNPIAASQNAGVEFANSSVSSPGLEKYLALNTQGPEATAQMEQVLALLVNDLAYSNLVDRGYLTVTFNQEQASAKWNYVNSIKTASYEMQTERSKELRMLAGQPVIQG